MLQRRAPVRGAEADREPVAPRPGVEEEREHLAHEEMGSVELPRGAVSAASEPESLAGSDTEDGLRHLASMSPHDGPRHPVCAQPVRSALVHDVAQRLPECVCRELLAQQSHRPGRKALLAPPTCGVMRTPGLSHRGWSAGRGSGSVTSRAARSRPDDVSWRRAPVSTTAPRATLTSSDPPGMAARNSRSTSPVVAGRSGTITITTSWRGNRSGRSSTPCTVGTRSSPSRGLLATAVSVTSKASAVQRWPCPQSRTHDEHPLVSQGRPELQWEPPGRSVPRRTPAGPAGRRG